MKFFSHGLLTVIAAGISSFYTVFFDVKDRSSAPVSFVFEIFF